MAEIKIKGDISGSTTIKAPDSGSDEVIELSTVLDGKAPLDSPTFTGTPALPSGTTLAGAALTSGKILQIVRATDSTNRSTTSTSFVDVTGMSVTITPQKNDSAIILIGTGRLDPDGTYVGFVRLTDSSDNLISGAGDAAYFGTQLFDSFVLIGYATPATTSATTYKMRFRVANASGTFEIENGSMTGQMYAIEVSA